MRTVAPLLMMYLASCSAWNTPSVIDQRAAVWQYQASARERQADADLAMQGRLLEQDRAGRDMANQQHAAQFAAGVAAQQAALARLLPVMRGCMVSRALWLKDHSTENADLIVNASLQSCRAAIVAVARTVERAHLSSEGLADEIAVRLRPEIKRMVVASNTQRRVAGESTILNAKP